MGEAAGNSIVLSRAQSPYIITVNLDGNRFASEPVAHLGRFGHGQVQIDQPRGQSFNVFDENTLAATFALPKCIRPTEDKGSLACFSKTGITPGDEFYLPESMEKVHSSIKEGFVKGGRYKFKADTLEELADQMGVNRKNFIDTVKEYNKSCERGADQHFFKRKDTLVPINKPPYYAFIGTLMTDGAFGGVQVNPEMQAYKRNGGLVEGLYVTGDFTSSRFINLGGVKLQVINDLSWAFSSGFLAGTNAARYLETLG